MTLSRFTFLGRDGCGNKRFLTVSANGAHMSTDQGIALAISNAAGDNATRVKLTLTGLWEDQHLPDEVKADRMRGVLILYCGPGWVVDSSTADALRAAGRQAQQHDAAALLDRLDKLMAVVEQCAPHLLGSEPDVKDARQALQDMGRRPLPVPASPARVRRVRKAPAAQ